MKRQILLLAITAAALSSCTTAYRSGQTPDDVYFSPARPQDEYVRVEEKEEYRYDDDYYDDRYLRMKVHNRTRWTYLDDWYAYDRYGYRANYYYGSYYNPYTSWNYYHNPYCRNNVIIYHPGTSVAQQNNPKPRTFNIASYTDTKYNTANNNINIKTYKPTAGRPVYNNTNSSKGLSNSIKQIFSNGGNNNSYSPPSRSYSPSSSSPASSNSSGSSGSSSGSSGSGGGGASRPSRGG
ncbi:MAG TPA: hypothetical protein VFP97_11340 [Chitinophagaceae bacterium]|nr:hypothetical protein [Chitinophagaceae bacterium]